MPSYEFPRLLRGMNVSRRRLGDIDIQLHTLMLAQVM